MEQLKQTVEQKMQELVQIVPDNIFGYNDDTMSVITGKLVQKTGSMIAVAESCTGGNIAHLYTEIPA